MIKKCLLIINSLSGNAKNASANKKLLNALRAEYAVDEIQISKNDQRLNIASLCRGYDTLCVSGGDGTFHTAINDIRNLDIDLLLHPVGTVNDFARTLKSAKANEGRKSVGLNAANQHSVDIGEFNDTLFSYVVATGTFTPIGYAPKSRRKKLFKKLSYWFSAVKHFRIKKINARIELGGASADNNLTTSSNTADNNLTISSNAAEDSFTTNGAVFEDVYTLIMAVKSNYVFGLNFNKQYKYNSGKGQLLLIKTPTGAFKLIKLFRLFFRAFFIGFKKDYNSKNIKLISFTNAKIDLEKEQECCVDGEKYISKTQNNIVIHKEKQSIALV